MSRAGATPTPGGTAPRLAGRVRPLSHAQRILERTDGSVLIVEGGYIGLEMADAFTHRGLRVTLAEQLPAVMPTVDTQLGHRIARELREYGVEVVDGAAIERIGPASGGLVVDGTAGFSPEVDLVRN